MTSWLSPEDASRLLAAGRLTVGTVGWTAPRLSARVLGLGRSTTARDGLPFVLRLFATRDVALGLGLLSAEGRDRDRWLVLGMMSDAGDAVAASMAGLRGQIPRLNASASVAAALAAVALGSVARGD